MMHGLLRLSPALLLAVCACAGPGSRAVPEEGPGYVPIRPDEPPPLGKFLADLDATIQRWMALSLSARSDRERANARELKAILERETGRRLDELIAALEGGPPRNRQRAAAALGFSADVRAQSPLVAALHDPDSDVVHNALVSLALLGLADTPTDEIVARLTGDPDPQTRGQAAYALRTIVEAGADVEAFVAPARLALVDPDPVVRSQVALILGLAGDGESVQRLGDLLQDDVPIVRGAATRALVLVGKRDGGSKGRAARALVGGWRGAKGADRDGLRRAMASLRGADLGDEEDDWIEWAHNLP